MEDVREADICPIVAYMMLPRRWDEYKASARDTSSSALNSSKSNKEGVLRPPPSMEAFDSSRGMDT